MEPAQTKIESGDAPPRPCIRDAGVVCRLLRRGMKAYLTRRYWFSASHRLNCSSMSEEENRSVYGKCNNPHGHGHNYALEGTLVSAVDQQTGTVFHPVGPGSVV